jgi:ferredoxin
MSDAANKAKNNVSGKYYVDQNCISCGQCKDIAKDFFAEDPNGGYYVCKQPVKPEEITICQDA